MNKVYIFTLSVLGFLIATTGLAYAKAKLKVNVSKATHKMSKYKNSGDLYPIKGPVIKVYSRDKKKYDSIANDNENMTFLFNVSASCNKKINTFKLLINGASKNVKHTSDKGRKVKKRIEEIKAPFTLPKISRSPAQACMKEIEKRVATSNKSKAAWMKSGFVVRYDNAYEGMVNGTCSSKLGFEDYESKKASMPVWIICQAVKGGQTPKKNTGTKKSGGKKTEKKAKAQKLKIALSVTPKTSEKCPTSIKFNGKITASKPGKVKYRIIAKDGEKRWITPVKILKFDKAGSKRISQWTHSYHKPDTSKSLAVKSSGGPKAVKGKARIVIVEKAKNTVVSGGAATYDIWCDGKPKRQKKKSRAAKRVE